MKNLWYPNPSDQTIRIRAYVGGASAINFGVPVKLDTNAAGMTAGINSQIPYIIQCTSETDAGVLGIITPCSHITYNKNSSTNHWYAAAGDLVEVVLQGVCRVVIGDAINTTTAVYGAIVSAGANGVVACPAANSYTIGKLLIHNAGYAYASNHEALMYVERSVIPALPALQTQVVNVDGAITITNGTVIVTKAADAAAITLAAPAAGDNYKIIRIVSTTAKAHQITFAAGKINGGANTTLTLGGAIGDAATIIAYGTVWYTLSTINGTVA
ncbi:MAG TPA: hypothetical protein PLS96_11785 [Myxococcota bacterium]|mgnify:FL=1|nr:hypothetical protein [Myxococcota bacterium]